MIKTTRQEVLIAIASVMLGGVITLSLTGRPREGQALAIFLMLFVLIGKRFVKRP